MIENINSTLQKATIDSRNVESKATTAVTSRRKSRRSPISTLFPKGDEVIVGDGSKIVRDTMARIKQGQPAGGFDEVPETISSIPKKLGPIMHHIVALMDGSSGERLREIAQDAQKALNDLAGGGIIRKKMSEDKGGNNIFEDSPSSIQRAMRLLQDDSISDDTQENLKPLDTASLNLDSSVE